MMGVDKVTILTSIAPIIILIVQLALMIFCLLKLSKKDTTESLSNQLWAFIIIFCALIGPIAYLFFED